jgi:hypothetical protein
LDSIIYEFSNTFGYGASRWRCGFVKVVVSSVIVARLASCIIFFDAEAINASSVLKVLGIRTWIAISGITGMVNFIEFSNTFVCGASRCSSVVVFVNSAIVARLASCIIYFVAEAINANSVLKVLDISTWCTNLVS